MSHYLVAFGLGEGEVERPTFNEALAVYIDHQSDRGGAKIWNLERCDDETDGLTEAEHDAIDLADEMHTSEVA